MRDTWIVAGVQMDCALGNPSANLAAISRNLARAADRGANLVVFPECVLTGYGFESREALRKVAEPLPGPSTDRLARECERLKAWAVFGLIEAAPDGKLYNACALVGPAGFVASYRKLHLPCLGADRFTDPGDRPFAVHDLGGLKLGMNICFDGSFPESARILTLLGADLVVLPTNWATNARKMAELVSAARAWENHIYYLAVNRVGDETGFHYIGHEFGRRLPRQRASLRRAGRGGDLHDRGEPRRGRPEARRPLPRRLRDRPGELAAARALRSASRGRTIPRAFQPVSSTSPPRLTRCSAPLQFRSGAKHRPTPLLRHPWRLDPDSLASWRLEKWLRLERWLGREPNLGWNMKKQMKNATARGAWAKGGPRRGRCSEGDPERMSDCC